MTSTKSTSVLDRILSIEIVRVTERAAVAAAHLRGRGYPQGVVELDAPPGENILALAKAKGVKPEEITALILDRPRHADMIAAVRKTGAAVRLITDGDVAGVIHTADAEGTGIDIYMGIGGGPQGGFGG